MQFFNFSKYFASEEDLAEDAVCKMRIMKNENLKKNFEGKNYYFCSENCLNEFTLNTVKFTNGA